MAATNKSKYRNVTVDGLSLRIPKDAFDDMEVADLLGEMEDGNIFAFPKLAKRIFGDEYKKVIEHLKGKDGRTKVSDACDFFNKTMKAIHAISAKN